MCWKERCTHTMTLQNAHDLQTGRVNTIMDIGSHGEQHVATRRRPFHPHTHTHTHTYTHTQKNIQTCSCTRGSENKRDIYCTDSESRYLHKGLHLVSLRWQWWGEGSPVNMNRYTLAQSVKLAAHRRDAVHTLLLRSCGCHRNSQRVSLGLRMWEGMSWGRRGAALKGARTENEDWGRETAAY